MSNHNEFDIYSSNEGQNKKQPNKEKLNVTHSLAKRRHQNQEEFGMEFNANNNNFNQETIRELLKDQMDGE